MATQINLPITKGTDQDYFEALRNICHSEPGQAFNLAKLSLVVPNNVKTYEFPSFSEADASDELKQILLAGGRVFHLLSADGSNGSKVTFRRTDDFGKGAPSGFEDKLILTLGDNLPEKQTNAFPPLLAVAQNASSSFSTGNLAGLLGEQAAENFRLRDAALTRLETTHANVLHDLEKQRKTHYEQLEAKTTALEGAYEQKQEQLETAYQERVAKLEKQKVELDKEKLAVDDRSSTHVRRELREKLKKILEERQKNFALSEDAAKRRAPIVRLYSLALIAFLAIGFFSFYQLYEARDATMVDYWLFGRVIGSSVGFFVFLSFFIRWLSHWASQHAKEEFKLKQLDLDIDRASWVVEIAFEWDEEKKNPIPAHLLETLSVNLFGKTEKTDDVSTTPADALAKLLTTGGGLEINLPGGAGKFVIDKNAIKQLNKSQKPSSD